MKRRRILLFCISFLTLFFLSCLQIEQEIHLNSDGLSGQIELKYTISSDLLGAPGVQGARWAIPVDKSAFSQLAMNDENLQLIYYQALRDDRQSLERITAVLSFDHPGALQSIYGFHSGFSYTTDAAGTHYLSIPVVRGISGDINSSPFAQLLNDAPIQPEVKFSIRSDNRDMWVRDSLFDAENQNSELSSNHSVRQWERSYSYEEMTAFDGTGFIAVQWR